MAGEAERLGCPPAKLTVHPLGIDLTAIPFVPRRPTAGQPLRLLVAATFVEKKGVPLAIAAVARAVAEGAGDLRLTVIGDARPEPRSRREKELVLAAAAGAGPRVELVGYCSHERMLEIAAGHQIFLAPSVTANDGDTEGGAPVALIEMAASGMAIVSTSHCDIPQVVRHGETGWLATERNLESLVAGIRWWIEAGSDWQPRLAASRALVESRFDAVAQGRSLARLYAEATSRSDRTGP
jgi:colanic acid/amylovoran biosynthesis glycosyltransferase